MPCRIRDAKEELATAVSSRNSFVRMENTLEKPIDIEFPIGIRRLIVE